MGKKIQIPDNSAQVHKIKGPVNIYAVGPLTGFWNCPRSCSQTVIVMFRDSCSSGHPPQPGPGLFHLGSSLYILLLHGYMDTATTLPLYNLAYCQRKYHKYIYNMTLMKDLKDMFWDSSLVSWLIRNNDKIISMTLNNSENFINKEWRRIINAITKSSSQWCRLCTISMLMTRHEMKWKLI